mgnify:CR=1 FL=1
MPLTGQTDIHISSFSFVLKGSEKHHQHRINRHDTHKPEYDLQQQIDSSFFLIHTITPSPILMKTSDKQLKRSPKAL